MGKQIFLIIILLTIILICVFGSYLALNDPNHVDLTIRFLSACNEYPLGTDHMGRCILSRLLYGGRTTLGIVLLSSVIIFFIGTPIGLLIGKGNLYHVILEITLNAVTAIPPIAYLLIFVGAWGNGIYTMLIAMTVSLLLRLIKLVKTKTNIELGKAYAMSSIACGSTKFYLLFVDVLPNVIRDIIHFICLSFADMILYITGFSFIGIGLGDNVIDWGSMVSDSRSVIISHQEIMLYPVLAIFLCTLGFNFIAYKIYRR